MRTSLLAGALALVALSACGDEAVVRTARSGGGWRETSASPLSPRHSTFAVAVGSEILFAGGSESTLCPPTADCVTRPEFRRDGAVYDPARDVWRAIAPAPLPVQAGDPTVVLGDVVHVLVRPDVMTTENQLLSYDVVKNSWTSRPAPEGYRALAAAGGQVVAYSTSDEHAAQQDHAAQHGQAQQDHVLDGGTGAWAPLPEDPLGPSFDRTMLWAGDRLVLLAPRLVPQPGGADGPSWLRAATYDVTSRSWTMLPETRQTISGQLTPVWTGTHVLNPSPGGADGGEVNSYGRVLPFGGRLDIASGSWTRLPDAKESLRGWSTYAVSPDWCAVGRLVLDVARDRWLELSAPPEPMEQGSSAGWAGDALVVWGGGTLATNGETRLTGEGAVWRPAAA